MGSRQWPVLHFSLLVLFLGNLDYHPYYTYGMTVYQFNFDHQPDQESRLQLSLKDAIKETEPYLSSLTVCIRFKITSFSVVERTIVNYAISDYDANYLTINVHTDGLKLIFGKTRLSISTELHPSWWYNVCATNNQSEIVFHADKEKVSQNDSQTVLPLNGTLVLGQDQDKIGGGFAALQSFEGELTDFNIWSSALTNEEIRQWFTCQSPNQTLLMEWDMIPWKVYNDSGHLIKYEANLCRPNNVMRKPRIIIFVEKRDWFDAFSYLQAHELDFMVPQNDQDILDAIKVLSFHKEDCMADYSTGSHAWLGLRSNHSKLIDVNVNKSVTFLPLDNKQIEKLKSHAHIQAVRQTIGNTWTLGYTTTLLCFIGLQSRPGHTYKLKGLPGEMHERMEFFLSISEESRIYFYNGYSITIENDGDKWQLKKQEEIIATLRGIEIPTGRREWTSSMKDINLTFSLCEGYTCTDGSCILQSQRCNQIYECPDGVDETNCVNAEPVNTHLLTVQPSNLVFLDMQLSLKYVGAVNIIDMTVDIDLSFEISWKDVRLQYRNLLMDDRAPFFNGLRVWTPKVTFENSPDIQEYEANNLYIITQSEGKRDGDDTIYSGKENSLLSITRIQTTVYCDFKLWRFPWDTHTCNTEIHIPNIKNGCEGYSGSSTLTYNRTKNLGTYILQNHHIDITNGSNRFFIGIVLQSSPENHLWIVYLPTTFLQLIGYTTLYLPVERFAERGGMSLTTLLVLISLYTDIASDLPRTSYLKLIDVWFVFTIVYLSLIIIVHVLTCESIPVVGQSDGNPLSFPRVHVKPENGNDENPRGKSRNFSKWMRFSRYFFGAAFVVFIITYALIIVVVD